MARTFDRDQLGLRDELLDLQCIVERDNAVCGPLCPMSCVCVSELQTKQQPVERDNCTYMDNEEALLRSFAYGVVSPVEIGEYPVGSAGLEGPFGPREVFKL